ncbi:MAG TPA: addiction module protein [Longimicrobium sp.]|nr:addiction module protein [Longimicrobium sp.]
MELPAETLHEEFWEVENAADFEAGWEAAIQARVDGIRNGTGEWSGLKEVLAELDQLQTELADEDLDDSEEDVDPAEHEQAWATEIERRVNEIRDGTAKTYAAEDVIAALRLHFG